MGWMGPLPIFSQDVVMRVQASSSRFANDSGNRMVFFLSIMFSLTSKSGQGSVREVDSVPIDLLPTGQHVVSVRVFVASAGRVPRPLGCRVHPGPPPPIRGKEPILRVGGVFRLPAGYARFGPMWSGFVVRVRLGFGDATVPARRVPEGLFGFSIMTRNSFMGIRF